MKRKQTFAYKNLKVWQKAIEFAHNAVLLSGNLNSSRRHFRLIEQFEPASASISQNIAEGKGRYSKKEFIQYLYIARGSLYETMSLAELFHRCSWINDRQFRMMEDAALELVAMLKGLINKIAQR